MGLSGSTRPLSRIAPSSSDGREKDTDRKRQPWHRQRSMASQETVRPEDRLRTPLSRVRTVLLPKALRASAVRGATDLTRVIPPRLPGLARNAPAKGRDGAPAGGGAGAGRGLWAPGGPRISVTLLQGRWPLPWKRGSAFVSAGGIRKRGAFRNSPATGAAFATGQDGFSVRQAAGMLFCNLQRRAPGMTRCHQDRLRWIG